MSENTMPSVDQIIKFESGEATAVETLELFSQLTKSGVVWSLQGSYGRFAQSLIEANYLDESGEITEWGRDFAEDADAGLAEGVAAEHEDSLA